MPAAVVPPLLVTFARRTSGSSFVSSRSAAAPMSVSRASVRAVSGGRPISSLAKLHASRKRKRNAGPDALTAVTASKSDSGTRTVVPTDAKSCSARAMSASEMAVSDAIAVMPRRTAAGVFGIARAIRASPPSDARMVALFTPAITDTTSGPSAAIAPSAAAAAGKFCGLTARTTISASRRALRSTARRPIWRASARRAASGSIAPISLGAAMPDAMAPRTMAFPTLPKPMIIRRGSIRATYPGRAGRGARKCPP